MFQLQQQPPQKQRAYKPTLRPQRRSHRHLELPGHRSQRNAPPHPHQGGETSDLCYLLTWTGRGWWWQLWPWHLLFPLGPVNRGACVSRGRLASRRSDLAQWAWALRAWGAGEEVSPSPPGPGPPRACPPESSTVNLAGARPPSPWHLSADWQPPRAHPESHPRPGLCQPQTPPGL